MNDTGTTDAVTEAFFALHQDLPRQGPGSDATTRRLLEMAGPLPEHPRVLDAGCGPGRSALLLAEEAGAHVTAVDLHQPFLDGLAAEAARRGLGDQVAVVNCSMDRLAVPDHSFDLIWAEGSVYSIGFDNALRAWRRLLAPGGVLVVTEIEWTAPDPAAAVSAYWDSVYPLRTRAANTDAARAAGYGVHAHWPLPENDWWDEYYTPLTQRLARVDPRRPGMPEALAAHRAEIDTRREHGSDYRYAAYILRPHPHPTAENGTMTSWTAVPKPLTTSPLSVPSSSRPFPPPPRPTSWTHCAPTPRRGSTACRWSPPPLTAPRSGTRCSHAATSAVNLPSPWHRARYCPRPSAPEPAPRPSAPPCPPPRPWERTSSSSWATPSTTLGSASHRPPASASDPRSTYLTKP